MPKILFTETYEKRARRFLLKHPELKDQYAKTLKLLEVNPKHPSLRLHRLKGALSRLFSVSINMAYRIVLNFIIEDEQIVPIDVGSHDGVY